VATYGPVATATGRHRISIVLACCTLLAGCAAATLDVTSPVPLPLDRVSLTIRDATGGDMSPDQMRSFKRTITRALLAAGIDVVPSPKPHTASVVGQVDSWEPGIRALRVVSKYGFGTGGLDTTWDVRDGSSDSLASCRIEGSVSTGTFGGSFDDVQEEAGRALARFLRGDIR
jgi:hypothetical protein